MSLNLVRSKSLIITIDNKHINVSVSNREDEVIIQVTEKIYDRSSYIGLGAGLGTLLVVIVSVAVVMGVVIYFYRK